MVWTNRGDDLLQRLLATEFDADGALANALLNEVFAGFPVARLAVLLDSDNEAAIHAGAWILSELGADAHPLIDHTANLLAHPRPAVRYHSLDAVMVAALDSDAGPLSKAAALIDDSEPTVRRRAMQLLAQLTSPQLRAARAAVADPRIRAELEWLQKVTEPGWDGAAVLEGLRSTSPIRRRVAVVAASRSDPEEPEIREAIEGSADPDVASWQIPSGKR